MKLLVVLLILFPGILRDSWISWLQTSVVPYEVQVENQSTQFEIRYHQPAAEAVEVVWGVNGWEASPISWGPDGTYIDDGKMISPMKKQGAYFSAILHVDSGSDVNFGFLVTPFSIRPDTHPLWEVDGENDFHAQVLQDEVLVVDSKLTDTEIWGFERSDVQNRTIEYIAPFAESSALIWGINGWLPLPAELLPEGTIVTDDGLMQTPMEPTDGTFSANLAIPPDVTMDFGFIVLPPEKYGSDAEFWDGDYQQTADMESSVRIQSNIKPSIWINRILMDNAWNIWLAGASIVFILSAVVVSTGIARIRNSSSQDNEQLISRRDLLIELVSRDIKLRYRRSVLGILWSLISPLLQLAVLGFVFWFILPLDVENYAVFLFVGLISWIWFQSSTMAGTTSIVDNREIIRRPNLPITILPIVPITSNLIHFVLSLPVLLLIIFLTGNRVVGTAVFLPLIILVQFLFTLSLVNFLAIFQVYFRDTEHIMSVILLLWFYLSPVFYSSTIIPEQYQLFYALNPMVHIINGYRDLLMYGQIPPPVPLLLIAAISLPAIIIGRLTMRRNYNRFVEEL